LRGLYLLEKLGLLEWLEVTSAGPTDEALEQAQAELAFPCRQAS
jgi:hypothetical protein